MLSLWWMESHGRLENFPIASAAPYGLSILVFISERLVKMIKFGVLCYISATQALPGTVCHWLTGTIWHRVFYFIFYCWFDELYTCSVQWLKCCISYTRVKLWDDEVALAASLREKPLHWLTQPCATHLELTPLNPRISK